MFRWLRDRKKSNKPSVHRKCKPEDDYGFRKKQIIVQETENGHSVIIKDEDKTITYPQSFCRFHFRARMPTPVQNFRETSSHIYDEIPEQSVKTKLDLATESDLIRDTKPLTRDSRVDFTNAIEVGPYLIVPIVNAQTSKPSGDVEIFKRDSDVENDDCEKGSRKCLCESPTCDTCSPGSQKEFAWLPNLSDEVSSQSVTRENSSLKGLKDTTNFQTDSDVIRSSMCSLTNNGAQENATNCPFRIFADSPGADSNSRTLTGSPDSSSRTLTESPDCSKAPNVSLESSETCAIPKKKYTKAKHSKKSKSGKTKQTEKSDTKVDGNETGYEYDLSTSGESERSQLSMHEDYELYLSKIESNLQLKQNVRKMVQDIENITIDTDEGSCNGDAASMTYVSSLSESSCSTQVTDLSADKSCSDDSGGYYECAEDTSGAKNRKRVHRVNLERSVSAPEGRPHTTKKKSKRQKDKLGDKSVKVPSHRSVSFDSRVYKALSDEERELYKFPSAGNSSSSVTSRSGRGKPAPLAPQPTPVYMDPYRGKSRSHNRLLGDLIRMNYDKQLFFH